MKTAGHLVGKELVRRGGGRRAARVLLHRLLMRRRGQLLLLVQQVLMVLEGLLVGRYRAGPPSGVVASAPRALVVLRHDKYTTTAGMRGQKGTRAVSFQSQYVGLLRAVALVPYKETDDNCNRAR